MQITKINRIGLDRLWMMLEMPQICEVCQMRQHVQTHYSAAGALPRLCDAQKFFEVRKSHAHVRLYGHVGVPYSAIFTPQFLRKPLAK